MAAAPNIPQIRLYQDWLRDTRGLAFDNYDALWRWSVTDLDAFWQSIWDYFDCSRRRRTRRCWPRRACRAREWFPGAQVNYARAGVPPCGRGARGRHAGRRQPQREGRAARTVAGPSCGGRSASLALHLQAQGVQPGDRVAAYLPNMPETIVAFLAVRRASARVWSLCAPDMGTAAVLDRFSQIEPKVLIACDGVTTAARRFDRSARGGGTARRAAQRAAPAAARNARRRAAGRCAAPMHDWRRRCARDDAEDRGVRAAVAAVRPSAVDRLFQRHHRPAQAHRARPWRHGHRRAGAERCCTTTSAAATAPTPWASASTGTARPAG